MMEFDEPANKADPVFKTPAPRSMVSRGSKEASPIELSPDEPDPILSSSILISKKVAVTPAAITKSPKRDRDVSLSSDDELLSFSHTSKRGRGRGRAAASKVSYAMPPLDPFDEVNFFQKTPVEEKKKRSLHDEFGFSSSAVKTKGKTSIANLLKDSARLERRKAIEADMMNEVCATGVLFAG
jgi:hypothetical protein